MKKIKVIEIRYCYLNKGDVTTLYETVDEAEKVGALVRWKRFCEGDGFVGIVDNGDGGFVQLDSYLDKYEIVEEVEDIFCAGEWELLKEAEKRGQKEGEWNLYIDDKFVGTSKGFVYDIIPWNSTTPDDSSKKITHCGCEVKLGSDVFVNGVLLTLTQDIVNRNTHLFKCE